MDATPQNMRKYEGRRDVVAIDPNTGETFSATPGDYFWLGDNEPLRGYAGEPLQLAVRIPEHYEGLPS